MKRIPSTVSDNLDFLKPQGIPVDALELGHIPFLYSLVPLAQSQRSPIHDLGKTGKLVGSQYKQVEDYQGLMGLLRPAARQYWVAVNDRLADLSCAGNSCEAVRSIPGRRRLRQRVRSRRPGQPPKTWPEFLADATALVHSPKHKKTIKKLIKEKKFLLALQGIRDRPTAPMPGSPEPQLQQSRFQGKRPAQVIPRSRLQNRHHQQLRQDIRQLLHGRRWSRRVQGHQLLLGGPC